MIIQAGFDLEFLARPLIVHQGKVLPRLVVIGLDANMQLESLEVASDQFAGKLEPHFDSILDKLDPEWTRYFAVAHAGVWTENCWPWDIPIIREAEGLKTLAKGRGYQMIGHVGLDATGYMSDGPPAYFDQYPLGEELPCTMDHWVHSRYGTCA
jgi:hypothetical protein